MYCEEVCIAASVLCNGWMMGDENCAALRVEHKSSKTLRSNRFWNDMDCNRPFEILSKGQKQKHNSHTLVYGILNLFLMMWQWLERSNPLGKGVNSCVKWKPASRKKPHHPCTVQLFPSMLPTHPNMEPAPIYIIRWQNLWTVRCLPPHPGTLFSWNIVHLLWWLCAIKIQAAFSGWSWELFQATICQHSAQYPPEDAVFVPFNPPPTDRRHRMKTHTIWSGSGEKT